MKFRSSDTHCLNNSIWIILFLKYIMVEKPWSAYWYIQPLVQNSLQYWKTHSKRLHTHSELAWWDLTSAIHLDEQAIKDLVWELAYPKNEAAAAAPNLAKSGSRSTEPGHFSEGRKGLLPLTSTNTHPMSASIAHAYDHEPSKPWAIQQPAEAGASVWSASWDFQPCDLRQICLGISDPPWTSSPSDVDQFIQLYAVPGEDHPINADQSAPLPEVPWLWGVTGTDFQCEGWHIYNSWERFGIQILPNGETFPNPLKGLISVYTDPSVRRDASTFYHGLTFLASESPQPNFCIEATNQPVFGGS